MATSDQVQQLYITYFGRPADPSGLAYWTSDSATPLSVIADGFATTPEFAADLEGRTLDQIVNSFYVDLFGRNAEPAGLAFWVGEIQNGNTTIQQVGLNIGDAALAPASLRNADNIALLSKIEASNQWTTTVAATTEGTLSYTGTNGVNAGVNYLIPVLTAATVPTEAATEAAVNALIQENGSGATQTLTLSVQQDVADGDGTSRLDSNGSVQSTSVFRFTNANQTVNGTFTTFSGVTTAHDILLDVSTLDQDVLNVTGVTDFSLLGANSTATAGSASVTNIENINIAAVGAANTFTNGSDATINAAQTFTVTGTVATGASGINLTGTGATTFDSSALTGATGNTFTVTTTNTATTVTTGTTNDVVNGGNGNDTVTTVAGNDSVNGGSGADTIDTGAGADSLLGGLGNDTLTGGSGIDQFQYTASTQGTDNITDFNTGEGDVLAITGLSLTAGDLNAVANIAAIRAAADDNAFIEITTAQTTAQITAAVAAAGAATNAAVIVFNSTTGFGEVWYDDDWATAASRVQLATLDNFTALADVTAITTANIL